MGIGGTKRLCSVPYFTVDSPFVAVFLCRKKGKDSNLKPPRAKVRVATSSSLYASLPFVFRLRQLEIASCLPNTRHPRSQCLLARVRLLAKEVEPQLSVSKNGSKSETHNPISV